MTSQLSLAVINCDISAVLSHPLVNTLSSLADVVTFTFERDSIYNNSRTIANRLSVFYGAGSVLCLFKARKAINLEVIFENYPYSKGLSQCLRIISKSNDDANHE